MRKLIALIAALVIALSLVAPVGAVTDNGTGIFWLYESSNGSGQWRDFNVGPDQTITFSGKRYVGGCPAAGCGYLSNTVSSARLSCGASGTPFSKFDSIKFYNLDIPSGTYYYVVKGLGTCTNGTVLISFPSTYTNWAQSMVVHNGG